MARSLILCFTTTWSSPWIHTMTECASLLRANSKRKYSLSFTPNALASPNPSSVSMLTYTWIIWFNVSAVVSSLVQSASVYRKKHHPHDHLQPIQMISIPYRDNRFHLSNPRRKQLRYLMSVTDKFSKMVLVVEGRHIWIPKDWVTAFLDSVCTKWEILKVIISDREPKFLSNFWQTMFKRLQCQQLMPRAYHLQMND